MRLGRGETPERHAVTRQEARLADQIGRPAIGFGPRKIRGNRLCTLLHFRALSCNGRLPNSWKFRHLCSTQGTHNAGVEGSSPSLSILISCT